MVSGLIYPVSFTFIQTFFNHFSTTGRCSGPTHYDVSIRQAARAAFATSSFKIFLTQTFPRCGATCYILPSRAMTQLFNDQCQFCVSLSGSLFNIFQLFASFSQNPKTSTMTDGINYIGDLPRYVLDRLFDNLTYKSY